MKFLDIKSILPLFMSILFFSCTGNSGEEGDGGDVSGDLVLKVSKSIIVADGEDAAVFTVMKGETDVTDDAKTKIYLGDDIFEGTTFSTSTVGEYKFFANYNDEVTEKQTIKAIEEGSIPVPDDSKPEEFSNFRHRALMVQSTGSWCQFCPLAIAGIKEYFENHSDGNAVFVAAHNGDIMANEYSSKINQWLSITGFPTITASLSSQEIISITQSPDLTAENISSKVSSISASECFTNIAASVSYSEDQKNLNILANVKVAKAGKYRIQAWVLEDGIYEEQVNSTGLSGDFNTHNNVLRYSSSSSATGEALGNTTESAAGTIEQFACSFEIDKLGVEDLGKCRVVIVTLNGFSGKFIADNVVECVIGGTAPYEYK